MDFLLIYKYETVLLLASSVDWNDNNIIDGIIK